ncbi:MAG: hypothetical protein JRG96_14345 [Deltaproteobacteria bacterium]|nr:hypothetical protein [Deltaproteobacteria bacterium]MBW2416927.1 hypothetical protein [Deltaproteobacteria bacterium]
MLRDSPVDRVSRFADSVSASKAAQLLWLIPVVYLAQNLAMPFNHSSEEALMADILRSIRAGELPFRDFIDIYGPLNWIVPGVAYTAAGGKWIAVRAAMIAVQTAVAVASYQLLRRLSSRFHAWIAAAMIVAVFGMAWFLHYAPYAFMQIYPMTLGIIGCLLFRTRSNAVRRSVGVGILVGLALLTKLSAGAFLLAGSLFVCFYLLPPISPIHYREQPSPVAAIQWRIFWVRTLGLVVFGVVFTLFILPHFELGYLLHLSLPLLLLLWCAGLEERKALLRWTSESHLEQLHYRLRHTALVVSACLLTVAGVLLLLWPLGMLGPMFEGLSVVLRHVDYHTPFDAPIFGKPQYRFSQAHWQQLPWLASGLLAVVLLLERSRWSGASRAADSTIHTTTDTTTHTVRRFRLLALFAIAVVAHHVIYPTADLGHLLQSFVPWILLLGLCLHRLEAPMAGASLYVFRAAVGLAVVLWIGAIAELPLDWERYRWRVDDDAGLSQQARYLKLRSEHPHLYDYGDFSSPEFQSGLIETARFLKEHAREGDRVWVLTPYWSLYFFADQPPYGGRYSWLVYSMTLGRLSREGFEVITRNEAGTSLVDPPPRFIVDGPEWASAALRGEFPEIDPWLRTVYRPVLRSGSMTIYARPQAAGAPPAPAR